MTRNFDKGTRETSFFRPKGFHRIRTKGLLLKVAFLNHLTNLIDAKRDVLNDSTIDRMKSIYIQVRFFSPNTTLCRQRKKEREKH
jgi:hypothetical protein